MGVFLYTYTEKCHHELKQIMGETFRMLCKNKVSMKMNLGAAF